MYSVVMMAALTAGSTSTGNWFRNSGCHGCHGWGHSTYAGNLCHGCYGVGSHGTYGHWGSYGSYGHYNSFSVYTPSTCFGTFGCVGCYGCYGGWSCYGTALPHHGYWHECPQGVIAPQEAVPGRVAPGRDPKIEETPLPREKKEDQVRARISIDVPAGAKVYLDGQLMRSTDTKRVFQTPALVPGQTYFYDVRVEIVRDGQTVSETQRVVLQPGQVAVAAFPNLNNRDTATAQTGR